MDPVTIVTIAISLFFILDPFASLPVFMSVTKGLDDGTVKSYADRAALVAAVLLVVFILIGPGFMEVLGITMDSFRVAGGIMLILMAVELVFDIDSSKGSGDKGAPWVIVATPILTGPGVITQAILLSADYGLTEIIIACTLALFVTWILLRNTAVIVRFVGRQAIGIFSRVVGLFIAAMGIEYIFVGSFDWFDIHEAASVLLHMFSI